MPDLDLSFMSKLPSNPVAEQNAILINQRNKQIIEEQAAAEQRLQFDFAKKQAAYKDIQSQINGFNQQPQYVTDDVIAASFQQQQPMQVPQQPVRAPQWSDPFSQQQTQAPQQPDPRMQQARMSLPRTPEGFEFQQKLMNAAEERVKKQADYLIRMAEVLSRNGATPKQFTPIVNSLTKLGPQYTNIAESIKSLGKDGEDISFLGGHIERIFSSEAPEDKKLVQQLGLTPEIVSKINPLDTFTYSKKDDGVYEFKTAKQQTHAYAEGNLDARLQELQYKKDKFEASIDPDIQGGVEAGKEYGKNIGKDAARAEFDIPKLEIKIAAINDTLKGIDDPERYRDLFGKVNDFKTRMAKWLPGKTYDQVTSNVRQREILKTKVVDAIDPELKKMFGPPFSEDDTKIMFELVGADLNSKDALKEVLLRAKQGHLNELDTLKKILNKVKPRTKPNGTPNNIPNDVPNNIPNGTPKALLPPHPGAKLDKARAKEYYKFYKDMGTARSAAVSDGWGL